MRPASHLTSPYALLTRFLRASYALPTRFLVPKARSSYQKRAFHLLRPEGPLIELNVYSWPTPYSVSPSKQMRAQESCVGYQQVPAQPNPGRFRDTLFHPRVRFH